MNNTVINAQGVSKKFIISRKHREGSILRKKTEFFALRDISFSVQAGEAVGLIGLNGSGKTTLSNIIAGVSRPSGGIMSVLGDVSMIAVNAGLSVELTGIENIEQKGLLIGLSRKKIRQLMPEIIEFADIGDFIEQPVRTYSSGMRSRLAFAISINIDPDILIIDEGLSVGDGTFVNRCLERIRRFRQEGKTMIFTSHSTPQVKQFCDRLIWLEGGRIRMDNDKDTVINEYDAFLKWYNELPDEDKRNYTNRIQEWQKSI